MLRLQELMLAFLAGIEARGFTELNPASWP
jgi:hypothetical protein